MPCASASPSTIRLTSPHVNARLSVDRPAGQDHLQRARFADDPGQALRAAVTGNQAELDLRQSQLCVRCRDPECTGERQLEAAAECEAVDDRNRRHRQALDLGEGCLAHLHAAPLLRQRAARQLADVRAGAERLRARPGHQQRACTTRRDLVQCAPKSRMRENDNALSASGRFSVRTANSSTRVSSMLTSPLLLCRIDPSDCFGADAPTLCPLRELALQDLPARGERKRIQSR